LCNAPVGKPALEQPPHLNNGNGELGTLLRERFDGAAVGEKAPYFG
jgi:hypothetical protein